MAGEQYRILGLPISFFFLVLFLSLVGFLIVIFFLRYLRSKYRCCISTNEGLPLGRDTANLEENEKPPSYDEAVQSPPPLLSTQESFTMPPKYDDVGEHCYCQTQPKGFLSNEAGVQVAGIHQWVSPNLEDDLGDCER